MNRIDINLEAISRDLHTQKINNADNVIKSYVQFRTIVETIKREVCNKKT